MLWRIYVYEHQVVCYIYCNIINSVSYLHKHHEYCHSLYIYRALYRMGSISHLTFLLKVNDTHRGISLSLWLTQGPPTQAVHLPACPSGPFQGKVAPRANSHPPHRPPVTYLPKCQRLQVWKNNKVCGVIVSHPLNLAPNSLRQDPVICHLFAVY